MNGPHRFHPLAVLLLLSGLASAAGAETEYPRNIKPILRERCYACHGALRQEAGLRLDTGALARRGSDNGVILEPGDPAASPLIERLVSEDNGYRMPPLGKPLAAEQIESFRQWIRAGAPSPDDEAPEADPADHWAFQIPVRAAPPAISNPAWASNPIDHFVHAAYDRMGLTPAADATAEELLRRAYLDLIGLSPTVEQVRAFQADPSDQHYRAVVDQLLESPQYGERWGRHWMDVWRYSDWYGRRQQNDVRNSAPQIWRWRDWIVNSLNADKSYARMIQEMLAADELAPDDDSTWPATGYLIRNYYSLNPNEWMRHNVEYTAKAFLGLTINCAHCHDHKYDPIANDDYFRLRAFFEPLGIRQDRVLGELEPPPFEPYTYGGSRKVVREGMVRVYDQHPDAPTWFYTGGDERNRVQDRGSTPPGVPAFLDVPLREIRPIELPMSAWYPGSRPHIQQAILDQRQAALKTAEEALRRAGDQPGDQIAPAEPGSATSRRHTSELGVQAASLDLQAARAVIAADNARREGDVEDRITALSQAARKAQLVATEANARWRIADAEFLRAEALALPDDDKSKAKQLAQCDQQLAAAKKDLEQAIAELAKPDASTEYMRLSPTTARHSTGRRAALALWITDARNPLTPRVAVNHLWMRHFHALVESVFDFGRNGKPPTHPKLLDWLAVELQEHGWSMKHLHRLMVTSHVYRLSSLSDKHDENVAADRDNHFLWRMNVGRMESELVRDNLLFVAGRLDLTRGGPPLPNAEALTTYRRGLYYEVFPEDGGGNEFGELFDPPDPMECFRRTSTIVPQQALALSNSELAHRSSAAVAEHLSAAGGLADQDFVTAAFLHILARSPSADEADACHRFLAAQREALKDGSRVRASLIRVLFNHNDFITVR